MSTEANSAGGGYVDKLLGALAIPMWNHEADTFPTLVNAIGRYSPDYPAPLVRFAGRSFAACRSRRAARVQFRGDRPAEDRTTKQSAGKKRNKIK